ncbi:MAG: hypothetical protein Q9204_005305 [Flavoplaca sp. TL-2023a]
MAGLKNDQPPPPYEEISSAPAYRNGSGRVPSKADEGNPFQQLSNNITNEIHPINQPSTDDSHIKLLIPSTRPSTLHFPYHPHLSSLGISLVEWTSFTSALASAATLSGAQKAKAISAAVGAGLVVNPWLGIVIGMWIWRREVRGLVLAGEREDGEEHSVGRVLGEWNRVWEGRGLRVGLVAPGVEAEGLVVDGQEEDGRGCGDSRQRASCGQRKERRERRRCGQPKGYIEGRKRDGCESCGPRRRVAEGKRCGQHRRCGGEERRHGCCRKDRGFKLLVERIGDTDQKIDDLEKNFAGLVADDANEKTA